MRYILLLNKQQRGPYSEAQIREFKDAGHLKSDSLLWPEGGTAWLPLAEIPALQQPAQSPPAPAEILAAPAPLPASSAAAQPGGSGANGLDKQATSDTDENAKHSAGKNSGAQSGFSAIVQKLIEHKHFILFVFLGMLLFLWTRDSNIELGASVKPGHKIFILLHGYGAPNDDLLPLAKKLAKNAPGVHLILPPAAYRQGCSGRSYRKNVRAKTMQQVHELWRAQRAQSRKLVMDIVHRLHKKHIPAQDIYVGGFSEGAIVSLDVAGNPESQGQIGGLIVLSGHFPKSLKDPKAYFARLVKHCKKLRVFISHGQTDSVVYSGDSKKLVAALAESENPPTFVEFDGGHTIAGKVIQALGSFLRED